MNLHTELNVFLLVGLFWFLTTCTKHLHSDSKFFCLLMLNIRHYCGLFSQRLLKQGVTLLRNCLNFIMISGSHRNTKKKISNNFGVVTPSFS